MRSCIRQKNVYIQDMRGLVFTILISLLVWACDLHDGGYVDLHAVTKAVHRPSVLEVSVDVSGKLDSVTMTYSDCYRNRDISVVDSVVLCPSKVHHDGDDVETHCRDFWGQCSGPWTAKIPLDEDHHLRFDLLDEDSVTKSYDVDMTPYLNAVVKENESFKISTYDEGVRLDAYVWANDTTMSDDGSLLETCFEYSVDSVAYDSSYKCCQGSVGKKEWNKFCSDYINESGYGVYLSGEGMCMQTPSRETCISDSVSLVVSEYHPVKNGSVPCKKLSLDRKAIVDDLWIVDDYVRRSQVKDSLDAFFDEAVVGFAYKKNFVWLATYGIGEQSSFETDSIVVLLKYSEK